MTRLPLSYEIILLDGIVTLWHVPTGLTTPLDSSDYAGVQAAIDQLFPTIMESMGFAYETESDFPRPKNPSVEKQLTQQKWHWHKIYLEIERSVQLARRRQLRERHAVKR